MPDLDERLATSRQRLIESIHQPALSQVAARAETLRRRRQATLVAAGTAVLVVAVALGTQPWQNRATGPRPAAPASPAPAGSPPVWSGLGITMTGIAGQVRDLPGDVTDVEFADPDHGYLLTADCANSGSACRLGFAATADGGRYWHLHDLPAGLRRVPVGKLPRLLTVGTRVVVASAAERYLTADAGVTWTPATVDPASGEQGDPAAGEQVDRVPPGSRLWSASPADPYSGCAAGPVLGWLPDAVGPVRLRAQPPIEVCWVAAAPDAAGGWWVGGMAAGHGPGQGRPALAVTYDGGRTWRPTVLGEDDTGGYRTQVATLGRHVYAVVLGRTAASEAAPPTDRILAIYHSSDGGGHFAPTRRAAAADRPATLAGDAVPLLDGRLLLAGQDLAWYVSTDDGATFTRVPGLLSARRVVRTVAGYLAYDLLGGGWTAFSVDGSNWYKINAR